MQININIDDYITEEEKAEIARDVFKRKLLDKSSDDWERIISNFAYNTVYQLVDAELDGKMAEKIKEKTIKVINELTEYSVFRRNDYWNEIESPATKIMTEAILNNKALFAEKVEAVIGNFDEEEIKQQLIDHAGYILEQKLFGK